MNAQTPLTFGSLFAGIGGFDLGFERAGMACKWQVEIDPYCQKVLAKHWPDVRRHDDIKTFPPTKPEEWQVDVICGGFPCQDISSSGRRAGLSGQKSGLFYEAIRVVCEVGPRIVVLENVAGLLTRGIDQVLGTLASVGFDAEWHCIPACYFGLPQGRDRVWIVAHVSSKRRKRLEERNSNRAFYKRWPNNNGLAEAQCRARSASSGKCRVAHGIPDRLDRVKALGNAVVPQIAEYLGRIVTDIYYNNKAAQ